MIWELRPLDTVFFRDSKPFSIGEETWADTIFPPFPPTIYGALRTAWFSENIKEFERLKSDNKLNSNEDPTKDLKINNIFIKKGADFLFPIPRDVLQNKKQELKRLTVSEKSHLTSAGDMNLLLNPTNEVYSYENCWISELDLIDYLNGDISKFGRPIEEFFEFEPKIGIARDRISHSSDEGKLYRVGMVRLKEDVKFCVDFEGLDIDKDLFKLGGEGRFVVVSKTKKRPDIPLPDIPDNNFLCYLSTPAIFNKGWLPNWNWIDEKRLIGTIPDTDIQIRLLTAAIGAAKFIGGFDMAKVQPKPMYKAVPEGSVYYFKILSGNKDDLKRIHGRSISDIYPEQGLGICYIGRY